MVAFMSNNIININQFRRSVYLLFPDITTHKQILDNFGNIDVFKLVEVANFDIYATGKRANYNDFYDYLEENKHLYDWWML